jgi:hypothetical protein
LHAENCSSQRSAGAEIKILCLEKMMGMLQAFLQGIALLT